LCPLMWGAQEKSEGAHQKNFGRRKAPALCPPTCKLLPTPLLQASALGNDGRADGPVEWSMGLCPRSLGMVDDDRWRRTTRTAAADDVKILKIAIKQHINVT